MNRNLVLSDILLNKIQKTDDDGSLQIYCSKDPVNEFQKSIRGTIFENETLIYRGFPYTEEFTQFDVNRIQQNNLVKMKACWSYEGTLLKIFYYKKWYISTHRKLDAFKSRWISVKSFGEIFVHGLQKYNLSFESFLQLLDTNKRYHFILLSTKETRIVANPELISETMFLVLTSNTNDEPIWPIEQIGTIPISQHLEIDSAEQIIDMVSNIDPFEKQGIIFYSDDFSKQYRVLNSKYREYASVRNNISSLRYCYILVRKDERQKKLFFELYPFTVDMMKTIENRILKLVDEMFAIYKRRYVLKQYVHVSQERHMILQLIHKQYLETKIPITIDDVLDLINKFPYSNKIYKIINFNETYKNTL